jgi:hypothetical protein
MLTPAPRNLVPKFQHIPAAQITALSSFEADVERLLCLAASALLHLPGKMGPSERLTWWPDFKRDAAESYGYDVFRAPRLQASSAEMEALELIERHWVVLSADERAVLILRSLLRPDGRPYHSWRGIARVRRRIARKLELPMSHEACRRIYATGLRRLIAHMNPAGGCFT